MHDNVLGTLEKKWISKDALLSKGLFIPGEIV